MIKDPLIRAAVEIFIGVAIFAALWHFGWHKTAIGIVCFECGALLAGSATSEIQDQLARINVTVERVEKSLERINDNVRDQGEALSRLPRQIAYEVRAYEPQEFEEEEWPPRPVDQPESDAH